MSQVTYPNATHTRFVHSLGTLALMAKILDVTSEVNFSKRQQENLRLAALLHDIGHYPYSHLMEKIDYVTLAEDLISQGCDAQFSAQVAFRFEIAGSEGKNFCFSGKLDSGDTKTSR